MTRTTTNRPRFALGARTHKILLTAHIAAAVGLLGDSAGFLAVAIRADSTGDPGFAASLYRLLEMFAMVFGIPLSFIALLLGLALGWGTAWGVFRYPWTMLKLALIVSVILVGALAISPALDAAQAGTGGHTALILASAWDVLALLTATALAVFKPRRLPIPRAVHER
jgi:hypothetical protein